MQSLIVLASLVFELAGRVKISGLPSPKLGPPWKKKYIFGVLVEKAINYVNSFNLKNLNIGSLFSSLFVIKHTKEQ